MEEALAHEACLSVATPFYCEETTWRVLHLAAEGGIDHRNLFAIFISNPIRCVPFLKQLRGDGSPNYLALWDYHVVPVILSTNTNVDEVLVYDVDSRLRFPTRLHQYLRDSLTAAKSHVEIPLNLKKDMIEIQFRVVGFYELQQQFSSDRRHMLIEGGSSVDQKKQYNQPPPSYPCITGAVTDDPHTLPRFLCVEGMKADDHLCGEVDMNCEDDPGMMFANQSELLEWFQSHLEGLQRRRAPASERM